MHVQLLDLSTFILTVWMGFFFLMFYLELGCLTLNCLKKWKLVMLPLCNFDDIRPCISTLTQLLALTGDLEHRVNVKAVLSNQRI